MTKRKRQNQYAERYRNSGKVQARPTPKGRHSNRRESKSRPWWDEELGDTLAHMRDMKFPPGPSVLVDLD